MTDTPTTAVNLDVLTKAFPADAVKRRKGGGGKFFDYVQGHAVIHRLNDATGNNWSFRVKSVEIQIIGQPPKEQKLLIAIGELEIPGHGVRSGMGVQVFADGSGEDLAKGVLTDCLKKCATLFGVALELYGPDYEDDDTESAQAEASHLDRHAPPRSQQPPAAPADAIDWMAQIAAATSPADIGRIGNAMLKAGIRAADHPAKSALREKSAALNRQVAEAVGAR